MKTLILSLFIVLISLSGISQTNYESAMAKGLEEFQNARTIDEMNKAAGYFDRIAAAETEEWLPLYYSSFIHCLISFQSEDVEKMQLHIDAAQEKMDAAMEIEDQESELYALQGMIYQAQIMTNPQVNGALYMGRANGVLTTAMKLNPENPRVFYLQGLMVLNTPSEYGGGKQAALPLLEQAVKLYESFKPAKKINPGWGKDDCLNMLAQCKSE